MKKLVRSTIIIFLLAFSMSSEAQSLRDYIRSRADSSDSLLLKGIMPSLSVVRQQYRLERGGEFYGKNNMPYYGECYTLAVKVAGATILQKRVIVPWIDDADYLRVNQSGNYRAVRFWSYQRTLNDSVYKAVEWGLDNRYTKPMDKDSMLYKNEDSVSDFGLEMDFTEGVKSGYIVWAYSSTNVQDSVMQVILRQSSFHMNVSSDSVDVVMTPNESEKVIGGVFVMPVYEPGGLIRLKLIGVASKSSKDKWILHLLTKHSSGGNAPALSNEDKSKKNGKKKKDTDSLSDEPTPVG